MIKKFITFIKERVFGIKPIFKIQVEKCSWSNEYVYIKFSKNNGWKWEYIVGQYYDAWSEYNGDRVEVRSFYCEDVEYLLDKLNTYEDCIAYNKKVYDSVKEHNKLKKEQYLSKKKQVNDLMKKYNK